MSRDITKACFLLQEFWPKLALWYANKYPGQTLIITHVDRTPVEQLKLFCQGRMPGYDGPIVTNLDGFVHMSKHNAVPSKAIDVAIIVAGKPDWSTVKAMNLATAVADLGYKGRVVWGGSFSFLDFYHYEVV